MGTSKFFPVNYFRTLSRATEGAGARRVLDARALPILPILIFFVFMQIRTAQFTSSLF